MPRLILYFPESKSQRHSSDCADVQAGLCLWCSNLTKSDFLTTRRVSEILTILFGSVRTEAYKNFPDLSKETTWSKIVVHPFPMSYLFNVYDLTISMLKTEKEKRS